MEHPVLFGGLRVQIHPDRATAGAAAAREAAEGINGAIAARGSARIALACAPSQIEMLAALIRAPVDWSRVTVFHLDEYVGFDAAHPASFRNYLHTHFLTRVGVARFHGFCGEAPDIAAECRRYAALLAEAPLDLVCLGIGENGHLAFNDPPVADFTGPEKVKMVELDEACRRQQVSDGCFGALEEVPRHALTLTIPMLLSAKRLVVTVLGSSKAAAVSDALRGPIATTCPASALRNHVATLHLDPAAASAAFPAQG